MLTPGAIVGAALTLFVQWVRHRWDKTESAASTAPFVNSRTSSPNLTVARRIRKVTNVYERKAQCKPLNVTEIEIMQHLADGLGSAEIAASRSTSAQVIKNYTYRACQKLGADNRAHLIAVAFRAGIIKWAYGVTLDLG
jgi:DNA-binding CsgD family transcriptional regulator